MFYVFYISLLYVCILTVFVSFYFFFFFLFQHFFFFFSSRRRHTRSLCDWSSDVCSSDLEPVPTQGGRRRGERGGRLGGDARPRSPPRRAPATLCRDRLRYVLLRHVHDPHQLIHGRLAFQHMPEIGRASCRERVTTSRGRL